MLTALYFFTSPLFRCQRWRCLHCGIESYYDRHNFLQTGHLLNCPRFPEEEKQQLCSEETTTSLISSESFRPSKFFNKERDLSIRELKSHSYQYNDPEFKHPRARCNYCDAVMIRNRIRNHLANCPGRPGNEALPTLKEQPSDSTSSRVDPQDLTEHFSEAQAVKLPNSSMLKRSFSLASDPKGQLARVSKLEVLKPPHSTLKELRSHFVSFNSPGNKKEGLDVDIAVWPLEAEPKPFLVIF
jgi:hypothetical protein